MAFPVIGGEAWRVGTSGTPSLGEMNLSLQPYKREASAPYLPIGAPAIPRRWYGSAHITTSHRLGGQGRLELSGRMTIDRPEPGSRR